MSDRRTPDFSTVHSAAHDRWPDILAAFGVPREALHNRHQPCPGCGGRDRFRFDDRDGCGTWICSQGGGEPAAGDGFALLEHVHGWDRGRALREVAAHLGLDGDNAPSRPEPPKPAPAPSQRKHEKRTTLAPSGWRRWQATRTITADDVAGRYLHGRGCTIPPDDGDLRWVPDARHWPTGHVGPALVALVTHPVTAQPVTLHLTWIAADGTGKATVQPDRLTLPGHTNEGVVRLWPDAEVTLGLAVAEGIESALTVARGFTPTWATLNAGNMGKLPALDGIEALTIVADNDDAGIQAARKCADRWTGAGTEVRLWHAHEHGADPNDVWRGAA